MRKHNGNIRYWIKERCSNEALKYSTKKEFNENASSAYVVSCREGWIDEITSHMKPLGHKYKRCIYSYEFSDNHVYIGLTYNLDTRHTDRILRSGDTMTKHILKTSLTPIRKQLTDYIFVEKAILMEEFYVQKYKNSGWKILNKHKTGGIGAGSLFWTKEKCIEAAKKCETRTKFSKKYRGAQSSSLKHGWMNEIHVIIKSNKGPKIKYTKKICREKANLCKTRKEFKERFLGEFTAAYKYGWLNEISKHMVRAGVKWTEEKCREVGLKCKNKFEMRMKYKGAHDAAIKNKWINNYFK